MDAPAAPTEGVWRRLSGGPAEAAAAAAAAATDEETFVINVGGARFETRRSTLLAVPDSRLAVLGALGRRHEAYRERQNDYFFDRHPGAFDAVLQYHRCGALHAHPGVCGSVLKKEFDYWGIDHSALEQCCWDAFNSSLSAASDFVKLDKLFADIEHPDEATIAAMPVFSRFRTKAWLTLEAPAYSRMAQAYLGVTTVFTLLSIAVFFAESHDALNVEYCRNLTDHTDIIPHDAEYFLCDSSQLAAAQNSSLVEVRKDYVPVLRYTDLTVYAFFLLDFILRAALSQSRKQFVTSASNIVDLICIISQTIAITARYMVFGAHIDQTTTLITSSTQWVRTFRLLRIFKILRHSIMVKVLTYTVLTAFRELLVVLVVLLTLVTLFGSIAYYVEPTTFPTIAYGCWWALVSLTTVGYGDVAPETAGGYIVGSVCALCGVFSVAFTVPIVVSNFNTYYNHAQSLRARKSDSAARTASADLCTFNGTGELRKPIQLTSYSKFSPTDGGYSNRSSMSEEVSIATDAGQHPPGLYYNGFGNADSRNVAEGVCEDIATAYEARKWGCNYGFVSGEGDACQSPDAKSSREAMR